MKALVISPQPFFSPRGTPLSVYYRTLVAAELGVTIDLLTYGEGQDVAIPGVKIIRIPRFSLLGPVRVGPSGLKLFLDLFVVLWAVKLLVRKRYDFVHAHEESVFFCRYLKPLFGFRLVYDMHSSLPQQLTNFDYTRFRPLIGLFEKLEKTSLENADAVITVCPELARYARAKIADPARHILIENSMLDEVRLEHRRPAGEAAAGLEKALPRGRPIVAYAGTFERYQGLDILIPAFGEVRKSRPDVFLLLIGGSGEQVDRYRRLTEQKGLEGHCLLTGQTEPSVARRLLRRASVVLSPRTEGSSTPLKIYEHLISGIPLVATRVLAHTQVLDDEVCLLAEPEPQSLARAILTALDDRARCSRVVKAATALYERKYSRPAYERKMRRLLEVLR